MKGPCFRDPPFNYLLEREWMAAKLAQQIGLPCAPPVKIRLNPVIVDHVQDPALQRGLRAGPDVLFGSINAGPGFHEWTDAITISRDKLQQATEIYLFDTIIQNWDRSVEQPNLLAMGEDLVMIDHGEAFIEATGTDADRAYNRPPWMLDSIRNAAGADDYERHPLWTKLRPKTQVNFPLAAQKWRALPEDSFDLIAAGVPDCWDRSAAQQIALFLKEAVARLDDILINIEHQLAR